MTVCVNLRSPDYQTTKNICADSLFTHDAPFDFVREHREHRLPYLYSLAIALSYTTEGRNQKLWKVADLLMTSNNQGRMTVNRALDTNILVVTILRFALHDQPDTMEQDRMGRFLKSLRGITIGSAGGRKTRWKSIYLIADLVQLLSQMDDQYGKYEQTKSLIRTANRYMEEVELERVPSDWAMKREGLESLIATYHLPVARCNNRMIFMTLAEIALQPLTYRQGMQTHIPRIREFSPATAEPRASRPRALMYPTHFHRPTKQMQTRCGPGAGTPHPQYRRRSLVHRRTTCKYKARCIHRTLSDRSTFRKLAPV